MTTKRGWVAALVAELADAASAQLGISGLVIRDLPVETPVCEVELRCEPVESERLRWFDAEAVVTMRIADDDREAIGVFVDEGAADARRSPWERPGWYDDAADWMVERLAAHGVTVDGPPRPIKGAWPASCVMRAEGGGKRWFFKAVGTKPPAESEVLPALRAIDPSAVPEVVAVDRGRRWMVLADFGATLEEANRDGAAIALAAFARLQIAAAGDLEAWLGRGCPDDRAVALAARVADLAGRHDGVADGAVTGPLSEAVLSVYGELESGPIPASIVHQDLRSGNVAWSDAGPVFYDWSDTVVAHPFFSCVRFIEFVEDTQGTTRFDKPEPTDALRTRLRDAYLAPWADLVGWDEARAQFSTTWRLQGAFQAVRWDRELAHGDPASAWTAWLPNAVKVCCEKGLQVLISP